MNEQRLKGLLGLAVRAGQASFGEDTCRRMIGSGRCALMLLDEGISANSKERYERLCESTETHLALLPADMIRSATGRDNMAMALKPGSIAEQVTRCLQ